MSVVTIILAAAFIGLYASTVQSLDHQSRFDLNAALTVSNKPVLGGPAVDHRKPVLTVLVDTDGKIIQINNHLFDVDASDVPEITRQALDSGQATGILHDYSLRYLIITYENGTIHLAFMDNAMEKSVIDDLLVNAALVGAGTIILFFIISILLARWVVMPVEKAWNSQRQFVADASHELKTPLTVILSNAEMLLSEPRAAEPATAQKVPQRLHNILEEARHMKVLVDELLTLARSDSVKKTGCQDKVDLSALVQNAALIYEPVFYDSGKHFEYAVDSGLYVRGDAARLRQLLELLLDNSLKYSPEGGLTSLHFHLVRGDICIEVKNDSETIPEEELDLIFKRFYRLDKSRSGSGFGLGLAIAETIVSEHHGRIWAKSELQRTTFTVQLPLLN
jgi:signal transduction histidine kinase